MYACAQRHEQVPVIRRKDDQRGLIGKGLNQRQRVALTLVEPGFVGTGYEVIELGRGDDSISAEGIIPVMRLVGHFAHNGQHHRTVGKFLVGIFQ